VADERLEQERHWGETLEELGPEIVRTRFAARMAVWEPEIYGNCPDDAFVKNWLATKARRARWNAKLHYWLLAIIALLTLIAATYPIVCPQFPQTWTALKKFCSH
jgi:hypothetical protein